MKRKKILAGLEMSGRVSRANAKIAKDRAEQARKDAQDTLFELMDLMRLKRSEQELIHKIFWYINSGDDNTMP